MESGIISELLGIEGSLDVAVKAKGKRAALKPERGNTSEAAKVRVVRRGGGGPFSLRDNKGGRFILQGRGDAQRILINRTLEVTGIQSCCKNKL